jgi:hypothetical protein
MAIDASLGDGNIRVHGLEIVFSAYFGDANIRPDRVSLNGFKPCVFKLICRTIIWVDRPETDESKVDPQFSVAFKEPNLLKRATMSCE